MATTSTARGSLASISARATPASRQGSHSHSTAIILPKLQVLPQSVRDTETEPGQVSFTPQASSRVLEGQRLTSKSGEHEGPVTAVVKDLELSFKPGSLSRTRAGNFTAAAVDSSRLEEPLVSQAGQDPHWLNAGASTGLGIKQRENWIPVPQERHSHVSTWPALQHRLWVDASNLPLSNPSRYQLNTDRRRFENRPLSMRSRRKDQMPTSQEQCHQKKAAQKLALPARGGGKSFESRLSEEAELVIGSPEKWRVGSSHIRRTHRGDGESVNFAEVKFLKESGDLPRLPSRLGRNSLDLYIHSSSPMVRSGMKSPVKGKRECAITTKGKREAGTATTDIAVASSVTDTSLRMKTLKLKGLVRNPALGPERLGPRLEKGKNQSLAETRLNRDATRLQSKSNKKQLSFSIPSADSDARVGGAVAGEASKRATLRDQKRRERGGVVERDVSLPQTPLHFEDMYCITKYIST